VGFFLSCPVAETFLASLFMGNTTTVFTLTTDFGLQDPYAGQLKGALLKGCPSATIIDLTHAIPAWDVVTAAITIRTSYSFFPSGTLHLIVVDPGVGSQRAILAAAGDGHYFIAPDNGILSLLVADHKIESIHRVEHPAFFPATVSPTFHGRDVMAPVATALAMSHALDDLGPVVPSDSIRMTIVPAAVHATGCLQGQVQRIDHFGNIRTNIRAGGGRFDPATFGFLKVGDQRISDFFQTYTQAKRGSLLVLVDSSGYLEIAANQANAAELLGCAPGDPISVHLAQK
jgi:S-adenosyl-L-methionine hydrolase (adenosine-forming)